MTRRVRLYLKRRVAQARNDMDRAFWKVIDLHAEFKDIHPDNAKLLESIAKGLILNKQLLESFWKVTWGILPEDWDTYVGSGKGRLENE